MVVIIVNHFVFCHGLINLFNPSCEITVMRLVSWPPVPCLDLGVWHSACGSSSALRNAGLLTEFLIASSSMALSYICFYCPFETHGSSKSIALYV